MHWWNSVRMSAGTSRPGVAAACRCVAETLEQRTLLTATLSSAIGVASGGPGSPATTINLSQHFTDPTVPGTLVEVSTPEGVIPLALTDTKTPKTVANFLNYINSGRYAGTIFHRSVQTPTPFVIQGGGYTTNGQHIPTFNTTLPSEAGTPNTTGTIAMALSTGPNSATSEWFINQANNSNLNGSSNGGPFTVFGNVVYGGMAVVNTIAALPVIDGTSLNSAFGTTLPVLNSSNGTAASNLVTTDYSIVPALTYTATSDDPSIVTPSISGSNLVLNWGSTVGKTQVNVTATDINGGKATTTFDVGAGLATVTLSKTGAQGVRFVEANGTQGFIALAGNGSMTVSFTGAGLTTHAHKSTIVTVNGKVQTVSVSVTGTDKGTWLDILGFGRSRIVNLSGLTVSGPLGKLNAGFATVNGDITFGGPVGSINLTRASNGTITIPGTSKTRVNLSLGTVSNESISSSSPISFLTARSWTGTGTISAPSIGDLTVPGAFSASVTAPTIKNFRAGAITGGTWTVSGNANSISARSIANWTASVGTLTKLLADSKIDSSKINVNGDITSLVAGNLTNSNIFSGVSSATLPATASDISGTTTIHSLLVRGKTANSNVAARTLSKVRLGAVQTNNNGTPFGVAAHTITDLTLTARGKPLHLRNVTTAAQVSTALKAQGITSQDLVIRIV